MSSRWTGTSTVRWTGTGAGTAAVALLCLAGCVSSPETKLASAQYGAALDAYTLNLRDFHDAWVAEIDELLRDLRDALVARAVTAKVRSLAVEYDGFSNPDRGRELARGGLVALSEIIDNERDRVHRLVHALDGIALPDSDDPDTIVDHVLADFREQSTSAIEATPGLPADERARLLTEARQGPVGADPVANAIVRMLITWRAAKAAIPRDVDNLESILYALRETHASVDLWIQTDVTVAGDDIAALVDAWSSALGDPE